MSLLLMTTRKRVLHRPKIVTRAII